MFSLAATWVIMLITLIALLVMHPALDDLSVVDCGQLRIEPPRRLRGHHQLRAQP